MCMSSNQTQISKEIADYIIRNFSVEDDFLRNLKQESLVKGIPDISISAGQGAILQFLFKSINAKYVLEIGSLAGYSTIIMARALPENGKLTAVEMNEKHAEFIKEKTTEAGLENKIDVVNQKALNFLNTFNPKHMLDFIFLDADKTEYLQYFNLAAKHLRKGGIIAADNPLAFGEIANPDAENEREDAKEIIAIRTFNETIRDRDDFFTIIVPVGDGLLLSYKL
jgi:caffeoyl-CoA O-methyltransferase